MIPKLVDCNASILKEKLPEFDFSNPPIDPEELAFTLLDALKHYNGLGLSACQVGLPYRVFVTQGDMVLFNPKIIDSSEETQNLEEGCLSYPYIFLKVKRPTRIRMRAANQRGEFNTGVFGGMTAQIMQHELDHLNGVTFKDKVARFHWDQAMNRKKKYERRLKQQKKELMKGKDLGNSIVTITS